MNFRQPAPKPDWTLLSAPAGARFAGGAGAIGRAVVEAGTARGHDVAVLDLPNSLAMHPPAVGPKTRPPACGSIHRDPQAHSR